MSACLIVCREGNSCGRFCGRGRGLVRSLASSYAGRRGGGQRRRLRRDVAGALGRTFGRDGCADGHHVHPRARSTRGPVESGAVPQPERRRRQLNRARRSQGSRGGWFRNCHGSRTCGCDGDGWWTKGRPGGRTWRRALRRAAGEDCAGGRDGAGFDWVTDEILVGDNASVGGSGRRHGTSLEGAERGSGRG